MKLDRKGMVGFPMRLAIAFLILSISVPAAMSAIGNIDGDSRMSSVSGEAEKLADTMANAYYSGNGSRFTVDLEIEDGCMVIVGGDGSEAYSIKVVCDDDMSVIPLDRPSIRVIGGSVTLAGDCHVICTCTCDENGYGMTVESV